MKTLSNQKELIKEDFKYLLQEEELKQYLSLIEDERFNLFEAYDENNMIKLKSDKDVIVIPEITFKVDENNDMTSLLDCYIIAIEFLFDDLIKTYESKHGKTEHMDLLDDFLIYLSDDNEILDFKGIAQLYDNRQFISYKVELKEVDKNNYIESIYNNVNKWVEYDKRTLNNIYKKLPKF